MIGQRAENKGSDERRKPPRNRQPRTRPVGLARHSSRRERNPKGIHISQPQPNDEQANHAQEWKRGEPEEREADERDSQRGEQYEETREGAGQTAADDAANQHRQKERGQRGGGIRLRERRIRGQETRAPKGDAPLGA